MKTFKLTFIDPIHSIVFTPIRIFIQIFLFFRYKVTKRTTNLMGIAPLTFVLAYYADLAYGSKLHRIRG